MIDLDATDSAAMDELLERGKQIRERRDLQGLTQLELAELAGYDSEDSVQRAESGKGNARSLTKLENALNKLEADFHADPNMENNFVEFRVSAEALGFDVTVKGPVTNREEIEASVVRIIREMRDARRD